MSTKFAICKCFYERNFYIHRWDKHVKFTTNFDEFASENKEFKLDECKLAFKDIEAELERRGQFIRGLSDVRRKIANNYYAKIDQSIFALNPKNHFDPRFIDLVSKIRERKCDVNLPQVKMLSEEIFVFPVFNEDFCTKLKIELANFNSRSDLPKNRPNTMSRNGILLDDLGMTNFFDAFRDDFLQSVCGALFNFKSTLDSHRYLNTSI